jgi:hypothetical protein
MLFRIGGVFIIDADTAILSEPAAVAQLVERVLGKDEVMGPNPISSSVIKQGRYGNRQAAMKCV